MSPHRLFIIVSMLLLAAVAVVAPAAEPDEGAAIFSVYCANCHGKTAQGDGPIAKLLRVRPADLTRLKKDGEFPAERVHAVIDGRRETKGHGYRDMPIWGLAFQDLGQDTNQEREVERRIEFLVDYLKSIQ